MITKTQRRKYILTVVGLLVLVYVGYVATSMENVNQIVTVIKQYLHPTHISYTARIESHTVVNHPTLPMRSVITPISSSNEASSRLQQGGASYSSVPSNPVYTTSSSEVSFIGGGSSFSSASYSSASYRHEVPSFSAASSSAFIYPSLARISQRSLSVDNTREAEAVVISSGSPTASAHNGHTVGGGSYPDIPFPDVIIDEPIGAVPVLFLLLLAGGYIALTLRRKQEA